MLIKTKHAMLILAAVACLPPISVSAASDASVKTAHEIFVAYYGRPGDPGGVEFWAEVLDQQNGDLSSIINEFGTSPEYDSRFGNLSEQELVSNLYVQMFGREAETDGLNFWADAIIQGQVTLGEAAIAIAGGASDTEEPDKTVFDKRVAVAERFTNEVSAQGKVYTLGNIPEARELILNVGSDTDVEEFSISSAITTLPSDKIKTVAASVSTSNAGDLAITAARGIKKAIINNNSSSSASFATSFGQVFATGIVIGADICTGGGTVDFNTNPAGTELDLFFNNCTIETQTLNGGFVATTSADSDTINMLFTNFTVFEATDGSTSFLSGVISSTFRADNSSITIYDNVTYADTFGEQYTIEYAEIECSIDSQGNQTCSFDEADFVDPFTGETYYIENDVVVETGSGEYDVTATVYDTEYGYVTVTTSGGISTNCSNGAITGGTITFEGDGETAVVELTSCEQFIVTVDGASTTYSWSAFAAN